VGGIKGEVFPAGTEFDLLGKRGKNVRKGVVVAGRRKGKNSGKRRQEEKNAPNIMEDATFSAQGGQERRECKKEKDKRDGERRGRGKRRTDVRKMN